MFRILLILICVVGCGESEYARRRLEEEQKRTAIEAERLRIQNERIHEEKERVRKTNESISKVNVCAEKLSYLVGEDGWFKRTDPDEKDAWGNQLTVRYKIQGGQETLIVVSNGPDGLPYTKDDIQSNSWTIDNNKVLEAMKKARHENRKVGVEDISSSLTKGLVKGVLQGWKK